MERKITLNRKCLKLDRVNAKAMIDGFSKGDRKIHQVIYLATRVEQFPKLITLNRHKKIPWEMSKIGQALNADSFSIPIKKYVAEIEETHEIRNERPLWEKVCTNGLFDVWEPEAPYGDYNKNKNGKRESCKIVLLRIYEILEGFNDREIERYGSCDRFDKITRLEVTAVKPVVTEEEFGRLKQLFLESINGFEIKSTDSYIESNIPQKAICKYPVLPDIDLPSKINVELPAGLQEICENIIKLKNDRDHKERAHESLVEEFFKFLGYKGYSEIKFRQGRIDIRLELGGKVLFAIEVKKDWNLSSRSKDAIKQVYNYAHEQGSRYAVITNGDYYKVYDLTKGLRYDEHFVCEFRLLELGEKDIEVIHKLSRQSISS
jgi:hypothetical protein